MTWILHGVKGILKKESEIIPIDKKIYIYLSLYLITLINIYLINIDYIHLHEYHLPLSDLKWHFFLIWEAIYTCIYFPGYSCLFLCPFFCFILFMCFLVNLLSSRKKNIFVPFMEAALDLLSNLERTKIFWG